MITKKPVGLYVHVPFCVTKCNYCKFYSVEYSISSAKSWKSDIVRELQIYEQVQYDTVFFGGGTPSLLYREVAEIISVIPMTCGVEITVEVNPDDVDSTMLQTLKQAGVNRLSIGVQSLNDSILVGLGRRHNAEQAVKAVELAHALGFMNISVDIMVGIPGQTWCELRGTIETLVNMPGITHISMYMYESEVTMPEDKAAELYLRSVGLLELHGFKQYEISNFGLACRHNLKYWNCEEYIGIGPSAHSYYGGKRFAGDDVTEENPGTFDERVMLKLRLVSGISRDDCTIGEWELLKKRAGLIARKYINITEKSIFLSTNGFLISNRIIVELLGNY
jgi:oxygen-independent coproporphyrinogen-3 oxidase